MKWVLYALAAVVGVVLLAVIGLLIVGGGRGESTLATTVEIDRPAPVVFDWITEPPRVKSWLGWLVEIQPQTPGVEGVGAREVWVMEDRNNNNQLMNIQVATTRYDRDRLLAVDVSAQEGFKGTVTYELTPVSDGRTRLSYRGDYQFEHWLAKLLSPIITRSAQQKLEEDLARLKQLAEAEGARGQR